MPMKLIPMNLPARAGSTTLPSPPGRRVGDEGRDATTGSWPQFATRTPWRLSPHSARIGDPLVHDFSYFPFGVRVAAAAFNWE